MAAPNGFRLRSAGSHRTLTARIVPTIVVGAGVAGLSAAIGLDRAGQRCLVVTDGLIGAAGSSPLAQGGVAAAVGPDDSPADHAADTLTVSADLAHPDMARILTEGGPAVIDELVALGAAFDRAPDGSLALGREAGHGRRRIVHADGDATGAAIMVTLAAAVRSRPGIGLAERTQVVDLVRGGPDGRRVAGVVAVGPDGRVELLLAPAVILATGGYGHCYARTTNPADVLGAGVAMAARAGATVADMEFVQFHPTALDVEGADRLPLLTEALRGEGAVLVNEAGERFLRGEHPDAELAPRDVVARANYRQLVAGHRPRLDARAAVGEAFPQRFPTVFALAMAHGLDPRVDLLPVTPAAHYCMGGVAVDGEGRTSRPGLWAAGEVTSSGLHGGNRLASNSLLEGLVMGRRVAMTVAATGSGGPSAPIGPWWLPDDADPFTAAGIDPAEEAAAVEAMRRTLWRGAGVVRHRTTMEAALAELDAVPPLTVRNSVTARTVYTVARLVLGAALARTESRGAHFRSDHPLADPAQAARRFVTPAVVASACWSAVEEPAALAS